MRRTGDDTRRRPSPRYVLDIFHLFLEIYYEIQYIIQSSYLNHKSNGISKSIKLIKYDKMNCVELEWLKLEKNYY